MYQKPKIELAKSTEMKINHIKKLLMKSIGHFYKYSVKYGIRKAKWNDDGHNHDDDGKENAKWKKMKKKTNIPTSNKMI